MKTPDVKYNPWSYWDFVFPIRWSSTRTSPLWAPIKKARFIFLILQFATGIAAWIFIASAFGDGNVNSQERLPANISDAFAIASWLGISWIYWKIYDARYQQNRVQET